MGVADFIPALMDNYFIKLIFLIHATLISMAVMAIQNNGDTSSYMFYNSILLIVLLSAIAMDKSPDIALVGSLFNGVCILLDILLLALNTYLGLMASLIIVLNLFFRTLSTVLLLRGYSARAGVEDPTSGFLEVNVQNVPRGRTAYQNIDEPSQALP